MYKYTNADNFRLDSDQIRRLGKIRPKMYIILILDSRTGNKTSLQKVGIMLTDAIRKYAHLQTVSSMFFLAPLFRAVL